MDKYKEYIFIFSITITVIVLGIISGIVLSINIDQSSTKTQLVANSSDENFNIEEKNKLEHIVDKIQENEPTPNDILDENVTYEDLTDENVVDEGLADENMTDKNIENKDNTEDSNTKPKTSKTQGKKGAIYLTFDDGPSSNITPKILDILKEQDVKATFFIVNYNENKEEILKRVLEEGHSIGIHGYTHTYSDIYINEDTYLNNINLLQEKIQETLGITIWITRFPGGSSNTVSEKYNEEVGLMSRLINIVEEKGYKYYDWNIDSDDAGLAKTNEKIYNNVIQGLSKNRPNVVLLHDTNSKGATLDALKDIIIYAKENGYFFEKITKDDDLIIHHNVNN